MKTTILRKLSNIVMATIAGEFGKYKQDSPWRDVIVTEKFITFISPRFVLIYHHGIFFGNIFEVYLHINQFIAFVSKIKEFPAILRYADDRIEMMDKGVLMTVPVKSMPGGIDRTAKELMPGEALYNGILTSRDIRHIIDASKFTADDKIRPAMQCVYLDSQHIVASDAHMLVEFKTSKLAEDINMLIPRYVVSILDTFKEHNIDVYMKEGRDARVYMKCEGVFELHYTLPAESYPNWKSVCPWHSKDSEKHKDRMVITVPTASLLNAVKDVAAYSNPSTQRVVIEYVSMHHKIKVIIKDSVRDVFSFFDIDIYHPQSRSITIGMKLHFLYEIMKRFENANAVEISLGDPTQAIAFNNQILCMPMMID
jgi:hypothetical protein